MIKLIILSQVTSETIVSVNNLTETETTKPFTLRYF